jgi:hypothetical protein
MTEFESARSTEARPAPTRETPDWRRLEVAKQRFEDPLAAGIARALEAHAEIDRDSARCIAHVLGRGLGPTSALAEYARRGAGDYSRLRDEYLALYADEHASPAVVELIDWFGSHLVAQNGTGSGRRFMNESLPPKLDQLLVRTAVRVDGDTFVVHLPASWNSSQEAELMSQLAELQLPSNAALQAFLSLSDVNAGTTELMRRFHEAFAGSFVDEEEALRALSPLEDWELGLSDWCLTQGLSAEALTWNYEPLMVQLREVYDLVETGGALHAFFR